jgi:hypothetical protein
MSPMPPPNVGTGAGDALPVAQYDEVLGIAVVRRESSCR